MVIASVAGPGELQATKRHFDLKDRTPTRRPGQHAHGTNRVVARTALIYLPASSDGSPTKHELVATALSAGDWGCSLFVFRELALSVFRGLALSVFRELALSVLHGTFHLLSIV